jgi:hypothetical protein
VVNVQTLRAGRAYMPINRVLQGSSFGPDEIRVLNEAYADSLRALSLVDRNDPLTELVAGKIVEIRRGGSRNAQQISQSAIKAPGLP